jgi:hypothetical protein
MARFVFSSREATTSATSASYTTPTDSVAVSFTWSGSLPRGSFANSGFPNHLFVVAPSGITLTAATPTTQTVNGYEAYGIMENANLARGANQQGFDAMLGDTTSRPSAAMTYNGTLNVHPTKLGGSRSVPVNTTLTMAVRKSGATNAFFQMIGDYVHLHVLAEAPPLGAFPPAVNSTDKTIRGTTAQLDFTRLRSLSLSFTETPSELYSYLPQDTADMFLPSRADSYRFLNQHTITNPNVADGYSRDYSPAIGKAMMALHSSSISTTDRNNLARRLVGWGIQLYGAANRYGAGAIDGGAGQGGGMHGPLFMAGLLLNNSTILTEANAQTSQMLMGFTIDETRFNVALPGKEGVNAQAYFDEHLGMPWIVPDEQTSAWDSRYMEAGSACMAWELLGVTALQQGAGSSSGLTAFLNGESIGGTGRRASGIAFLDRLKLFNFAIGGGFPASEWRTTYDTIQAAVGWTKWSGKPDQFPFDDNTETTRWFSAGPGNGQIQWNFTAFDGDGNGTISSTDVRFSLNGFQYFGANGVGENSHSGTAGVTLATGMPYYASGRRQNEFGAGPWSANYPRSSTTVRNFITTPGSKSGAPTFVVDPIIVEKIAPNWTQTLGNWRSAATPSINSVEFASGAGNLTGNYVMTDFTYQFKLDGTNEGSASATNTFLADPATMRGKVLSCDVSVSNGNGSDSATATGVTIPSYYFYYVNNVLGSASSVSSDSISIPIGPANANRWVVVIQTASRNAGVPNAASMNSVSMDKLATVDGAGTRLHNVFMSSAKVASGTTATMDVTGTGTWFGNARYFSFVILSATKPTLEDISTLWRTGSGTSALDPLPVVDGGAVLLFGDGDGNVGGNTITTDAPFAYINQYSGAGTDVWLAQGAHVTVTDTLNINVTSAFGWIQGLGVSALSFSNIT